MTTKRNWRKFKISLKILPNREANLLRKKQMLIKRKKWLLLPTKRNMNLWRKKYKRLKFKLQSLKRSIKMMLNLKNKKKMILKLKNKKMYWKIKNNNTKIFWERSLEKNTQEKLLLNKCLRNKMRKQKY